MLLGMEEIAKKGMEDDISRYAFRARKLHRLDGECVLFHDEYDFQDDYDDFGYEAASTARDCAVTTHKKNKKKEAIAYKTSHPSNFEA